MIDPWSGVVGQSRAVGELRAASENPAHAYLLVGPRGSGKRTLAAAFASVLLSTDRPDPERHRRLALAEAHPDLIVVERAGPAISAEQASWVVDRANMAPVESSRKVMVLDEFHLVSPLVGPKLLKTIEEPPGDTVFVVLADEVTPDLVTVASRCVRVELDPVAERDIVDALVADGVEPEVAQEAASVAAGDLRRARVLAADEGLAERRRAWEQVPDRLDGTGAAAFVAVDELFTMIDDALGPLRARQAAELAEFDDQAEASGARGGSGRKQLVERHTREERRYRTDEVLFGLTTLARRYGSELARSSRPGPEMEAVRAVGRTAEGLVRNPNVQLQIQALFMELGNLGRGTSRHP